MIRFLLFLFILLWPVEKAFTKENQYVNPIINVDFSDPDVLASADGKGYYMTASSFASTPALPILFSEDLVNWDIVNYALPKLEPADFFNQKPQHGKGVWAPSLRYHDGLYYITWGDPDFGVFKITATDPKGKWSKPMLVIPGRGLIDACPLWDDDGRAYMINAWAGSRSKFNSVLTLREMENDLSAPIGNPVIVYDGNSDGNHTVEGPKLYKKDGFYYIMAPAGGVEQGWQIALRSDNIYGPYDCRTVMAQGSTDINGPHQGGWTITPNGDYWFLNFQDKGWLGRVVHLNPMKWIDGWPVIGIDKNASGCGEPVRKYNMPLPDSKQRITRNYIDYFNTTTLPLRWEWAGNYQETFGFTSTAGFTRLYGWNKSNDDNLWTVPNLLLQKAPGDEFVATAHINFTSKRNTKEAYAGLVLFGWNYAAIAIREIEGNMALCVVECIDAEQNGKESITKICDIENLSEYKAGSIPNITTEIWLRATLNANHQCSFSWSYDGKKFHNASAPLFTARQGKWVGARIGVFATNGTEGDKCWLDLIDFEVKNIK